MSCNTLCGQPRPAAGRCPADSSTGGNQEPRPPHPGPAAEELLCVYLSDRAQTGGRESKEKTRRQVVMRVHKWLIKPRFLLVAVVKQF